MESRRYSPGNLRHPVALLVCLVLLCLQACGEDPPVNPGDTTPPEAIDDLAASLLDSTSVLLTWTAPGDEEAPAAAVYDVRFAVSDTVLWEEMTRLENLTAPADAGVAETLRVGDLEEDTPHFFLMRAADDVPNWSPLSNVASVRTHEVLPPRAVDDLDVVAMTSTEATLSWTAPGDDGDIGQAALYDLRYVRAPEFLEEDWDTAFRVEGLRAPKEAGGREQWTVAELEEDVIYSFALRTQDAAGNISSRSNTRSFKLQDRTSPAEIRDLSIVRATATTVTLSWTAPGDDGERGAAALYDLRYTRGISLNGWYRATEFEGEPVPGDSGEREQVTVGGLEPDSPYTFAISAADEAMNWSGVSNTPWTDTISPGDENWWDGFARFPEGHGYEGEIYCMTVHDGALVVGGRASKADGREFLGVARWDGSSWSSLGAGIPGAGEVVALCVHDGQLFAGGTFESAGGGETRYIARWDGATWDPLGGGLDGPVLALASFGDDLIVGGEFTQAGGVAAAGLARWDGGRFTSMPGSPLSHVTALAVYDGDLYAGGGEVVDEDVIYVTRWNGEGWDTILTKPYVISSIPTTEVRGMIIHDGRLAVAVRHFFNIFVRLWDGAAWSPERTMLWSGSMRAEGPLTIGEHGGRLLVGGEIAIPNDGEGLLVWDNGDWTSLGSGLHRDQTFDPGRVRALATFQGRLYVGGLFDFAGGNPSLNIARWDE